MNEIILNCASSKKQTKHTITEQEEQELEEDGGLLLSTVLKINSKAIKAHPHLPLFTAPTLSLVTFSL